MKPSVLLESGSLPGVGQIHISEIKPTIKMLEKTLGEDLYDNMLGSAGKREFSGDIDIAIDIDQEDIPAFIDRLKQAPNVSDVTKTSVIMTRVKIQNFDESKQSGGLRTGYVQVDFMLGETEWLKTFYHAPHESESNYKGVYRNILLSAISANYNTTESDEKIDDGRPVEIERWMWSPRDGLVRVVRTPVPNKRGDGYTKKNNNKIIDGPYKTPEEIVKQLNLGGVESLNSYESLKAAIEKRYRKKTVNAILKDFAENPLIQDMGIPSDIEHLVKENIQEGSTEWYSVVRKIVS